MWKSRHLQYLSFSTPCYDIAVNCHRGVNSNLKWLFCRLVVYLGEGATLWDIYNCTSINKKSTVRMTEVSNCDYTRITWSITRVPNFTGKEICHFTRRLLLLKALTNVRCSAGSSKYLFSLCFILSYKSSFIRANSHPVSRMAEISSPPILTKILWHSYNFSYAMWKAYLASSSPLNSIS